MRKVILMMLVAVSGIITANAQFTKGTKTLGLKTDFSLVRADHNFYDYRGEGRDKITGISFTNPRITGSYFVLDKLAITAGLGYSVREIKAYSVRNHFGEILYPAHISEPSIDFSIGGKYYFWKNIFGGLSAQSSTLIDDDYCTLFSGDIEAGATFYISHKVFIEPAIFFKKNFSTNYYDDANFGLSVNVGFKF